LTGLIGDPPDRTEHADIGASIDNRTRDNAVHDGGPAGLNHEVSHDPAIKFEADPGRRLLSRSLGAPEHYVPAAF
jgi:hypothetical protein